MRRHGTLSISQWSVSGKSRSVLLLARGFPDRGPAKSSLVTVSCVWSKRGWRRQMFTSKFEVLTAGDLREACIEACG